jgi:hypothetical protein
VPDATPLQRATAVAERQYGAISYRQARSAGLTEHQVRGLVARGSWDRPSRGLFTIAGSPSTPQRATMVAQLAATEAGGVVSHLSAAALHGLTGHPDRPHITVPAGGRSVSQLAHVHRSDVPPVDRAHRGPFTTTSVSRALVDCATLLDRPLLSDLVDEALCRKLATQASVQAAADRTGPGRRGTRLVRQVVEVWSPQLAPGSPAEVRALRLLTELGIGDLVAQFEVLDDDGTFVARLDLAAPARRLGFEYDGARFHGPRQWARDEARYARLRALGWTVASLDKLDLVPGEPRLRQLVQRYPERSDQLCAPTAP